MSQLNPLNDLSRVYLDHVSKINQQNESDDIKRWQEGENDLQKQIRISSGIIASGGAPTMEEEKKAAKDYDGDGKIESGKDEYFGSKDKAIKKAMGKKVKEDTDNYVEAYVAELNKATMGSYVKKASKDLSDRRFDQGRSEKATYEPDKDDDKEEMKLRQREKGISRAATKLSKEELELDEAERSIDDRLDRKNKLMKKTTRKAMQFARDEGEASGHARFNMSRLGREREKLIAKKNVKKEALSNWRDDLSDLIEVAPMTDVEAEKVVKEKKVNNKVTINPKMSEAVAQIGGEVIYETEVELQEKQKDTPDQVKAVIAFDKARKGTDDATYDSEHGKKKQAKKERDYAKWQRDKGAEDAQKSGHRWKHAKGSTREKEGKKSETHAYIKDSVEYILDNLHNLNEADIADILARLEKKRISKGGNPDESPLGKKTGRAMKSQQDKARKKAGVSEGVLGKEVKELQKAGKTLKDTPVVKADKTANPNYKGQKFGVKEGDDWIQKAVKRPGAFTRKAKAAGQSVQQFAKTVDDNPGKYSTRTKKQANLAQTFASMKKEDVEELFYTLIAE